MANGKQTVSRSKRPTHGLLGNCPELKTALKQARRFARTPAPIVISGPTGTGKELMARYIHRSSFRRSRPFVVVDCPNLPPTLIESELFGYAQGAFTGAGRARAGLIEQAAGGTLFLDEVADLPLDMQAKLLRFLQEGTTKRVGGNERIHVDARVVVASWRDLAERVRQGLFREDLYHRLAWGQVDLPPLSSRGHDIILLARDFLATGEALGGIRKGLKRDAIPVLLAHDWPGNVRELHRVLFRAVLLGTGKRISGRDIEAVLNRDTPLPRQVVEGTLSERLLARLEEMGKMSAQDLAHGLGVSRSHIQRLLAKAIHEGLVVKIHRSASTQYQISGAVFPDSEDPRWAVALRLVSDEGRVTRARLAGELAVSDRTATRILSAMVSAGRLVTDGKTGRLIGYSVTHSC